MEDVGCANNHLFAAHIEKLVDIFLELNHIRIRRVALLDFLDEPSVGQNIVNV